MTFLDEDRTILSEIAEESEIGNFVAKRDDNVSFFYNITDKGNEYLGYETKNQKLMFSEPMFKTSYPQSFGTFFEGNFAGLISYKNSTSTTPVKGTYSTHADATGTIILPNITLQVLRVHTTERMEYNGNTAQVIDKYLWYAQDVRYPVFVSIETYYERQDGTASCASTNSYLNLNLNKSFDAPTDIQNIAGNVDYKVSPNPFVNVIKVEYNLPEATNVNIELYNVAGAKLATLVNNETQVGENVLSEDISTLTSVSDVYILKMTFGNQVYTEKVIKK